MTTPPRHRMCPLCTVDAHNACARYSRDCGCTHGGSAEPFQPGPLPWDDPNHDVRADFRAVLAYELGRTSRDHHLRPSLSVE